MSFVEPIRSWYGRFERPISSLSLVLGFVFDAVTLRRVDMLWENIWTAGHLVIVGVFILLIHLQKNEAGGETNPKKAHFWYVNILQFFFGGLLSTFLVFYFRSADIFVTWPFILLLAIAFLANESMKRHYVRLGFQISLFFLSVYSFAIFFLPVVLHKIGDWVFLLAGLASLVFISLFLSILFFFIKDRFEESKKVIFIAIGSIFIVVNILYFTNLIPPIPLSLKDGGIYHSVQKNYNGTYTATYENHGIFGYFTLYPNFNEVPGSPIYAYSAVFSPTGLNLTIIHEWQYYDTTQKKWITDREINLAVRGGRDGGFRTFSKRSGLPAGKWRVNVRTEQGQTVGQMRFNIVPVGTLPPLATEIK